MIVTGKSGDWFRVKYDAKGNLESWWEPETKKRFDSLESFIKKEIESLGDRLKSEQEERAQASKEISRELRDTSRNLDKRIAQLDELTTKNQRELRQQVRQAEIRVGCAVPPERRPEHTAESYEFKQTWG